ncbi:hypothetical protein BB559_003966 [Furculomyces boomerangus]|uniref:Uncharacterized protein n=1 Tax=Furculomyces boomerangus TaxID=61424 RepID=A0A2T9YHI9_9FUNG|nr:hypothetical protein BB559_003966 [Furculomyces boomerangus]
MVSNPQKQYKDNHNQWIFTKEEMNCTPSIIDGMSYQEEWDTRYKGIAFIDKVLRPLKRPQIVISTASVLFHRFYMRQSLKVIHHYDIAGTVAFLSTKIEENKMGLLAVAHSCAQVGSRSTLKVDDSLVEKWKGVILKYEAIVLELVCFDMNIIHPYNTIEHFLSSFAFPVKVGKMAWAFVNDK